ncbi:MAG: peptidyl-prolyl cis-trans isomerase [Pirellulales bacterium]|nr:peptidyl-prolyl cis-trans isomerase [Pirellulales bacterium]
MRDEVRILARVGDELILASEVRAVAVRQMLPKLNEVEPDQQREAVDALWPQFLKLAIESKLMYVNARNKLPAEGIEQIEKRINGFFKTDPDGMKGLLEDAKLKTEEELEAHLNQLGTTLAWQKRVFLERSIGRMWMLQEEVKIDEPISHEEMLAFYQRHHDEYEHAARAQWEELMVRFSRYPDKETAYAAIAKMGNLVMRGAPFAEVAKTGSDGTTAAKGGDRGWTRQGCLVSKNLDAALFGLPVGSLSQIIEDDKGYHIIRVLQREPAYRTPFAEVQKDIAEKIRKGRGSKEIERYIAGLRQNISVWISPEVTALRDGDDDAPRR